MGERMKNMEKMMNNPKQRNIYLAVVGLMGLMVVSGVYFVAKNTRSAGSQSGAQVAGIPNGVVGVPGSSTSPEYNKKIRESNDLGAKAALEQNKSFIPTPGGKASVIAASPMDALMAQQAKQVKPKPEQAESKKPDAVATSLPKATSEPQTVKTSYEVQQAQPQPQAERLKYGESDYALVATLLGRQTARKSHSEFNYAGSADLLKGGGAAIRQPSLNNAASSAASADKGSQNVGTVYKAGTVLDAVLETAVNSDEPSPILATIVTGPLSGTKLIGSIKDLGQKLVLQFSTANVPGLRNSIAVSAVAIDQNSDRTALASSVDNHYLERYGMLFASAFLSGWSQAISSQNATTNVSGLGGVTVSQGQYTSKQINEMALGNVGTAMASQAQQNVSQIKPTVKINSGVALGILLMSDLTIK